ncbi:vomeronasal type-2 receptor 26-like [Varanus komodoensis]|uniref:vomeronasal type-2 receptor 26-like n=1 Tax=Varanus komodoensis TaxID=61221 RepID=UPI001CF7D8FD|nr:vomeronasal type-2 receptor 26-like [Varanus komodoensis]
MNGITRLNAPLSLLSICAGLPASDRLARSLPTAHVLASSPVFHLLLPTPSLLVYLPSSCTTPPNPAVPASIRNPVQLCAHMRLLAVVFFVLTKFYQHILSLVFAVREINENPKILQNVTLGFHIYDSYNQPHMTYNAILDLLFKSHRLVPNYECDTHRKIFAVIGALDFDTSLRMANILNPYKIPQLTYGSFVPAANEVMERPSFYHMVPNEAHQYMGIIRLLKLFGWTWVGFFVEDDEQGECFLQVLEPLLSQYGICTDFTRRIPGQEQFSSASETNPVAHSMYQLINFRKSRVFVIYGETYTIQYIMYFINGKGAPERKANALAGKVWIITAQIDFVLASISWDSDLQFFQGAIYFSIHSNEVPGFQKFVQMLKPDWTQTGGFLWEFWEQALDCSVPHPMGGCMGEEELGRLLGHSFEMYMTGHSYSIYNAVYAVAHALQALCSSKFNQRSIVEGKKGDLKTLQSWQVLPISVCSDSCQPGYQKRNKEGDKFCCYYCDSCPEGKISNQTDTDDCFKCPDNRYPSKDQDQCIPKVISFLSYEEPLGKSVVSVSVCFSLIIALVLQTFIKHRDTPIVKANNRALTYTLLLSLLLCFLSSLLFLGQPRKMTCLRQQPLFGFNFSVAISCVLAKTTTAIVAFTAIKPAPNMRKWVGKRLAISIVFSCSIMQAGICAIWLTTSSPFVDLDMKLLSEEIIMECRVGSIIMFYLVLGYMGLLAIISFSVAFFARKLPDTFNEAKFITFSMLVFCSVWLSFVPTYLSTKGKYMVVVEIFSIFASSAGLLGCIFFPKCYIIIVRPDLNMRGRLIKRIS